jgi:hypothetical protein
MFVQLENMGRYDLKQFTDAMGGDARPETIPNLDKDGALEMHLFVPVAHAPRRAGLVSALRAAGVAALAAAVVLLVVQAW